MAISLAGVSKVLYLGDSLTYGMFSSTEATSWRGLTNTYLATQSIAAGTYIGGANGQTSGYQSILATLTAQAADLCFIELGTNDASAGVSAATFETNMRAIAEAVKDGNADCIFVFMTTWNEGTPGAALDIVIRNVAADYGDHLVELGNIYPAPETAKPPGTATWVEDPYNYESDGWHPNDTGHKAIANAVECLFDADLVRINTPVGTAGTYTTANDYIYFTFAVGSDYSTSGQFGIWVRPSGGTPWYYGGVELPDGNPAYYEQIVTDLILDGSSNHIGVSTGDYITLGWRETPGSGDWTTLVDFSSVTFALTLLGVMTFTAPTANTVATIGDSVTVSWDYGGAIATGDFAIWLEDANEGGYYVGDIVEADGSQTYSHALTLAAADGIEEAHTYNIVIAYRDEGGGQDWYHWTTCDYSVTTVPPGMSLLYDDLDLNDGTTYLLLEGFDPGEKVKTWDEMRSYTGEVAQYNVSEAYLIEMHIPLRIMGTSPSTFRAAVDAINDKIDEGDHTLYHNDGAGVLTYSCVHSPRIRVPDSLAKLVGYCVDVDLVLYRTP